MTEIARSPRFKDVGQRQRPKPHEQPGIVVLGKAELVMMREIRAPIDIDILRMPFHRLARLARSRRGLDALELVLEGGEDYELLVAAPEEFERTPPGRSFRRVGTLERGEGVLLRGRDGSSRGLTGRGFAHR